MRIFPVVLIYLVSANLFAQTAEQSSVMQKPTKLKSRDHREGKSTSVLLQPIGWGPSHSVTQAVGFDFFLNANNMLQLEVASNSLSYQGWYEKVNTSSVAFRYKGFVANSLYLKPGLELRSIKYKYDSFWDNILARNNYNFEFEGYSSVVSFAIGNQWQFSTFTIGCDWIGIAYPFQSRITSEYSSDGHIRKSSEDSKQRYLNEPQLMAARFYLGVSF